MDVLGLWEADLNPEPSCCEATVLTTTALPCHVTEFSMAVCKMVTISNLLIFVSGHECYIFIFYFLMFLIAMFALSVHICTKSCSCTTKKKAFS